MKKIILPIAIFTIVSCGSNESKKEENKSDAKQENEANENDSSDETVLTLPDIDGTWIPVREEMGGKEMPAQMMQGQKLILEDSIYTFMAESEDKGTVVYDNEKMTITGNDGPNAGRTIKAIYKIENNHLIICYNLAGQDYPTSYSTIDNPKYFVAEFEKE